MGQVPSSLAPIHVQALAQRNGWRREVIGESVRGIPIESWWPTSTPTRVVWAAIHGEESVTLQMLHELLRSTSADDACAVVVPVLNPDGVLHGTRQNANGVDLNRNFPGEHWRPDTSPTFWPTAMTRTTEFRNQLSSPGTHGGSEPETQAICALVERVQPRFVIDFHTPLECVIAFSDDAVPMAEHLAAPTGMRILRELESATPGDSATWCASHGVIAVTYEYELAPLPQLWHRHRAAVTNAVVDRFEA